MLQQLWPAASVSANPRGGHFRTCLAKRSGVTTTAQHPAAQKNGGGRRGESQVRGFQPSQQLVQNLQRILVDLIELHLQGKQAHWTVVGTNFRDLHLQLDELVDFAREGSDTIRTVHDAVDAEDPSTADNPYEQIDGLEKLAWLIKSENLKA
jgi:hypothetical protein